MNKLKRLVKLFTIFSLSLTFISCGKKKNALDGEIATPSEVEAEPEKIVVRNDNIGSFEVDGKLYREVFISNLGVIIPIPDVFDIISTADPFNVYFLSSDPAYENVMIGVTETNNTVIDIRSNTGFYINAHDRIAECVKFPITAGATLTFRNLLGTNPFGTKDIFGEADVYVDMSDNTEFYDGKPPYMEYIKIPNDVPGLYQTRKHYVGELNTGYMTLSTSASEINTGNVYCNFLLSSSNQTEFITYVLSAKSKQARADEIVNVITSDIQYDLPAQGSTEIATTRIELGNIELIVPTDWETTDIGKCIRKTNKDFNSAFLGDTVFAFETDASKGELYRQIVNNSIGKELYPADTDENALFRIYPVDYENFDVITLAQENPTDLSKYSEVPIIIMFKVIQLKDDEKYVIGITTKDNNMDYSFDLLKRICNTAG